MAPMSKTMKVMKVAMKTTKTMQPIKKPAADDDLPGKKGTTDILNAAALAKLENSSDGKVQSFLDELGDKDQQRLWKRFESNRKIEGTEEEYKTLTGGTGKILAIAMPYL